MATISLAEKLRGKLNQTYEENKTDRNEFIPDWGKTKVRIIPGSYLFGKNKDNELFYWNYSFHYIPATSEDEKGQYVYTPQFFEDGTRCPIDEAAEQMFESEDKKIRSIASQIKRKRVYYFHAIVYEDGKDPRLVLLKDNTANGKLAEKICSIMGMPFVKDVHQKRPWIEGSKAVAGKPVYDLIDLDNGHDLIIDKTKGKSFPDKNGKPVYDINYSESFAWSEPRSLSAAERELIKDLPDLTALNKWETDPKEVEAKLNKFLNNTPVDDTPAETPAASKVPVAAQKNPALNVKTDEPVSGSSEADILAELEAAGAGN